MSRANAAGIRIYDGATVLITGGASGLGRALGEALAQRGAEVVLADRQSALAHEVAAGIRDRGGKAHAVALDVRNPEDFRRVAKETAERSGRIDFFFNNAGIGVFGELRDYAGDDWERVIDVNLNGVYYGVRAVYPIMMKQGFGHIINTASIAGMVPTPMVASYSATKHAVVGLSMTLRTEAERHGVRVSVLCPGPVRTPIFTGGVYGKVMYGMDNQKVLQWWEKLRPIDPPEFARQTLVAVAKNEPMIIVPGWLKPLMALLRLSPRLASWLATQMHRNTLKSFPEVEGGRAASKPEAPTTQIRVGSRLD